MRNTIDEQAKYEKYWQKKMPTQVLPGIHRLVDEKRSRRSRGEVYKRVGHYDEYGRMIGQTHYTSHGEPAMHPNPHHHRRNPISRQQLVNPDNGTKIWPGIHPAETIS